jgi:hypothetical protein
MTNDVLKNISKLTDKFENEYDKTVKLANKEFDDSDFIDNIAKGGMVYGTVKSVPGINGLQYLFSADPEKDLLGMLKKLTTGGTTINAIIPMVKGIMNKMGLDSNVRDVVTNVGTKMKSEIVSLYKDGTIKKSGLSVFLKFRRAISKEKRKAKKLPPEQQAKRLAVIAAIVMLAKTMYSIYKKREKIMNKISKKYDVKLNESVLLEEMPKPSEDEEKNDFISRFMSNNQMEKEFPDNKQRVAVAYSVWDNNRGDE